MPDLQTRKFSSTGQLWLQLGTKFPNSQHSITHESDIKNNQICNQNKESLEDIILYLANHPIGKHKEINGIQFFSKKISSAVKISQDKYSKCLQVKEKPKNSKFSGLEKENSSSFFLKKKQSLTRNPF